MSTTRLGQLQQLSCKIFSNVYNPTCARTGNKVLRQRLIGSSLTTYNPQTLVKFRDIQALYPQLGLVNLEERNVWMRLPEEREEEKELPRRVSFIIFYKETHDIDMSHCIGQGKRASNKKK